MCDGFTSGDSDDRGEREPCRRHVPSRSEIRSGPRHGSRHRRRSIHDCCRQPGSGNTRTVEVQSSPVLGPAQPFDTPRPLSFHVGAGTFGATQVRRMMCGEWESNPHDPFGSQDFKSRAYCQFRHPRVEGRGRTSGQRSTGCCRGYLSVPLRCRSFARPPMPSASMKRPPKSGVASMRPVRENASAAAMRLSADATNASTTASFCDGVGGVTRGA